MVDDLLLQVKKLLSQRLAKNAPVLRETSCLHPDEAEVIGYIEAYNRLFEDKDDFAKWLSTKAKSALEAIGMGKWYRDELTHLGLRLGEPTHKKETVQPLKRKRV